MIKVKFSNVGRGKRSWTAETNKITYSWLKSQAQKCGGLMSNDLEFDEDGLILAGFRTVGKFEILEGEPASV